MRCRTCAAELREEEKHCPVCGAFSRPGTPNEPEENRITHEAGVPPETQVQWALPPCPRCRLPVGGTPYFRRPSRYFALAATSFLSLGIGGIFYWGFRRKHRICPRCATVWRPALNSPSAIRRGAVPPVAASLPHPGARHVGDTLPSTDIALPSKGIKRRVFGIATLSLVPLLIFASFVGGEPAGMVFATLAAALGITTLTWGKRSLAARRKAIRDDEVRSVHRFAAQRGGRLTVTELATGLHLSFAEAEAQLASLEDGERVCSQVNPDGIIYYEFPEIIFGKDLTPLPGTVLDKKGEVRPTDG